MAAIDKLVGAGLLLLSIIIFIHYTLWVIVTPFIDADQAIQAYFPRREYAVMIPAIILLLGITVVVTFVGVVLVKSGAKSKPKSE